MVRARRRRGGGRGALGLNGVMRKGVIAVGVGMAEREGYLARVPEIGQLGTIGSLGVICWGLRRFAGVNMPVLDDVAEVCAITFGIKLGREGLTGGAQPAARVTSSAGVSGTDDEFAIQGDEFADY